MPGQRRQLVKYDFYKVDPRWRGLPPAEREAGKEQFLSVVEEFGGRMMLRSYSLVGVRGDCDFLLWKAADDIEAFQEFGAQLNRTALAQYLSLPYSYLAMKRPSQYVGRHQHAGQEGPATRVRPGDAPYFIVYPFVKTREWYLLPKEERQRMMNVHFEVGHRYPSVKINTTHSFGLDDQEFVVAFETSSLSDFLNLVMELRESEASRFTLRDTPIFTCVARDLRATLDDIAG